MSRFISCLAAIHTHSEWPGVKDTERAWYLAALVFAQHYRDTSICYRGAAALRLADSLFEGRAALNENHPTFVVAGVIEAAINEGLMRAPMSPHTIADLFYVYHAYWRKYRRTLRGGDFCDRHWGYMRNCFGNLPREERTALFEEFVEVMLKESEHDDWILAELVTLLPMHPAMANVVQRVINQQSVSDCVGRGVWENLVSMSRDHAERLAQSPAA